VFLLFIIVGVVQLNLKCGKKEISKLLLYLVWMLMILTNVTIKKGRKISSNACMMTSNV
jgi:hypothetical protein